MNTTKSIITFLSVFSVLFSSGCAKDDSDTPDNVDYRQEMRNFVANLGSYAKSYNNNFFIIPQNGQELITDNGEADGSLDMLYLQSIDATGRESMFYGYYNDDEQTPVEDKQHLLNLCLLCEQYGVEVLTTDYCSTTSKIDDSFQKNNENNFISFAADERDLNSIPNYPASPFNENSDDVLTISKAKNFLYLINTENFATKQGFIDAVSATNYDVVIMDLFHNETSFTQSEIEELKTKKNGGKRLIICYLSIGEAEDYRYYWQESWNTVKPAWLEAENPDWEGNYKVKYWDSGWQQVIFGNDNSYLKKIIDTGFNGVHLDIVDGFEYFEER